VSQAASDDEVYKDRDFVQPPQRASPDKRKGKTAVDPAKSRGRDALPTWAKKIIDRLVMSLYMLYASFYDPARLDHPVPDDDNPDSCYSFRANFLALLKELSPSHYDEVATTIPSSKVYQYVSRILPPPLPKITHVDGPYARRLRSCSQCTDA
jgi:hypothetical protein